MTDGLTILDIHNWDLFLAYVARYQDEVTREDRDLLDDLAEWCNRYAELEFDDPVTKAQESKAQALIASYRPFFDRLDYRVACLCSAAYRRMGMLN